MSNLEPRIFILFFIVCCLMWEQYSIVLPACWINVLIQPFIWFCGQKKNIPCLTASIEDTVDENNILSVERWGIVSGSRRANFPGPTHFSQTWQLVHNRATVALYGSENNHWHQKMGFLKELMRMLWIPGLLSQLKCIKKKINKMLSYHFWKNLGLDLFSFLIKLS